MYNVQQATLTSYTPTNAGVDGDADGSLEQAERLCDRVAILHEGRLAALGAPASLRADLAPGGSLEDVFFQVAAESDEEVAGSGTSAEPAE